MLIVDEIWKITKQREKLFSITKKCWFNKKKQKLIIDSNDKRTDTKQMRKLMKWLMQWWKNASTQRRRIAIEKKNCKKTFSKQWEIDKV